MTSLRALLGSIPHATKEDAEAFAKEIDQHPTWFIWSLAQLQCDPVPEGAQRIALLYVRNARKFKYSLSNVAGIRLFDNSRGSYVAVNLIAYEKAFELNLLDRSASTVMDLVAAFSDCGTQLLDFFEPERVDPRDRAFAWLGGFTRPNWDENSRLLGKYFKVEPVDYTRNIVRVSDLPSKRPMRSGKQLAVVLSRRFGSLVDGAVAESNIRLRTREELGKAVEKLCCLLDSGQTMSKIWRFKRIDNADWDIDARWRAAINLDAAWAEVGHHHEDKDWFEKCQAARRHQSEETLRSVPELPKFRRPVVVVLDTTVDFEHPSLFHTWVGTGDATPPRSEALSDQLRRNYHGTACASLVAGYDEEVGFRGVGAGALLGSIRVRAGTSSNDYGFPIGKLAPSLDADLANGDAVAKAIRAAVEAEANVISMSLQYNTATSAAEEDLEMRKVREAIEFAASKNVCVVVAAGNAANSADVKLKFPAYMDEVIAVAATQDFKLVGKKASEIWLATCGVCKECKFGDLEFPKSECKGGSGCWQGDCLASTLFGSRRGNEVAVAAPGTRIWVADVSDFGGIKLGAASGNYFEFYATSAAAPIVAGTIALMLMVHPGLKAAEAKAILRATAERRPVRTADWADERPETMPFGFLDCAAAVKAASLLEGIARSTPGPKTFAGKTTADVERRR